MISLVSSVAGEGVQKGRQAMARNRRLNLSPRATHSPNLDIHHCPSEELRTCERVPLCRKLVDDTKAQPS